MGYIDRFGIYRFDGGQRAAEVDNVSHLAKDAREFGLAREAVERRRRRRRTAIDEEPGSIFEPPTAVDDEEEWP